MFLCYQKKKSVIMGYTQCCPNVLESFFEDTKLSIFEIFTLTFGWSHGKDFRTSKGDYSSIIHVRIVDTIIMFILENPEDLTRVMNKRNIWGNWQGALRSWGSGILGQLMIFRRSLQFYLLTCLFHKLNNLFIEVSAMCWK